MEQNQVVDEATTTRALPFVAFAIAYVLVGGAIFSVSNALLRHSSLDDPDVILLSVLLLTVGLGWPWPLRWRAELSAGSEMRTALSCPANKPDCCGRAGFQSEHFPVLDRIAA